MADLTTLASELEADDFASIPIIDITHAHSSDSAEQHRLADEIRKACLTAGFFYGRSGDVLPRFPALKEAVKNHSVSKQVVDGAFGAARDFFSLSSATKNSVSYHQSNNFRGYMELLSENNNPENLGEMHEAFNLGLDPTLAPAPQEGQADDLKDVGNGEMEHGGNLWPGQREWQGTEVFKRAVLAYYSAVLALGQSLFPLFALALDLPATFFDDKTRHPAAIMRLLHYPPVRPEDVDERKPGIAPHTDFECFTILSQGDVQALQVQNRRREWIDAPCIPDTFIINIGDQFARWTNDIFVSTPHRVLPPTRTRYSVPFFFGCDHDVPLVPPSTCVSETRPRRYETIGAGAYVKMRLGEIYASTERAEHEASQA